MSAYRDTISEFTTNDPRHVEAWMRLAHPTLDHLNRAEFEHEVCVANACISMATEEENEALAVSYGLGMEKS